MARLGRCSPAPGRPVVTPGTGRTAPRDRRFSTGAPFSQPAPPDLPEGLAALIGDVEAVPELVWVAPRSEVWRYESTAGVRCVKWAAPGPQVAEVQGEVERLAWLADTLPPDAGLVVPSVIGAAVRDDAWLVTEAVAGLQATDPIHLMSSPEGLADLVGRSLRRLHDALPVEGCPYSARVDRLVTSAEARLAAGGLVAEDLPAPFTGRDPAEAVAWLAAHAPDEPGPDLVVAHGDPSLPNFLLNAVDEPVGLVDLGRLGVSDRHRDLAIVVRSFAANFGPELVWRLTDAYGLPTPSAVRLEWYRIADDLV